MNTNNIRTQLSSMAEIRTQTDENTATVKQLVEAQTQNDKWDNRLAMGLTISLAWSLLLTVLFLVMFLHQHYQNQDQTARLNLVLQTQTRCVNQTEALETRLNQLSAQNQAQINSLTNQVNRHLIFLRYVEDWIKNQRK